MVTTISVNSPSRSIVPHGIDFLNHHGAKIALAIGIEVQKDGVAPKMSQEELCHRVAEIQWKPHHPA